MKILTDQLKERHSEFVTKSSEETIELGRQLGSLIEPPLVILLCGNLGSGKTIFTKGLSSGLGVDDENEVTSPTFVIINEYQGRCKIYHVDLYRLDTPRDTETIGFEELLENHAIVIVEWGEKLPLVPDKGLVVEIFDLGGDERKIKLSWICDRANPA